jgi:hypothetical protein
LGANGLHAVVVPQYFYSMRLFACPHHWELPMSAQGPKMTFLGHVREGLTQSAALAFVCSASLYAGCIHCVISASRPRGSA